MKFGEFLVQKQKISPQALQEGIEVQRYKPVRLGRLLRDLGHISQDELNRELHFYFLPKVAPSLKRMGEEIKRKVEHGSISTEVIQWAHEHDLLVLDETAQEIRLIAGWYRDEVLEQAERRFGRPCAFTIIAFESMNLVRHIAGLAEPARERSALRIETAQTDDQRIGTSDPYTSLFRDTILAAREARASDIHIQPTASGVDIRFRIDGDMITWKKVSIEHRRSFINAVKRLTNLSIAVSGKAQDGRISFNAWQLDLRTSLLPSQYGEKIVLRLLDLTRTFELSALGFDQKTLADVKTALKAKNGVLIISGPTGSGKTTTLYTLLHALDHETRNIITLEDPIEYRIEGLTQVQVSKKLSFADALRSVLRQDPDVILVGEIRDAETADLCVKAASTGHLVLSTLHANGAAEVIARMKNLGIDPYLLKSVLRFSSAQRLVKRLCSRCSIIDTEAARALLSANALAPSNSSEGSVENFRKRHPQGCPHCKAGIVGRVPVLEYMREDAIASFLNGSDAEAPRATVSLKEATLMRAEKGEVDYHDVLEVE